MPKTHNVDAIIDSPVLYLISTAEPWTFRTSDIIEDVPLSELITRLGPEQHLYFVDFTHPGQTRLTRLM